MAYLKGSRVTGLSPKPLDVKGFTQSASEDLEGKYSQHEVLLADAFNVTDDVTISDNLILTKLSDDGNAITVTGDASATRTISGSGSLEGSTFAQTPNASLTSMTGVLGSAITGTLGSGVTGGSGLTALGTVTSGTLGSGVTYPAGHTLQTKYATDNTRYAFAPGANAWAEMTTDLRISIQGASTSNKFLMRMDIPVSEGGTGYIWMFKFWNVTTGSIVTPYGSTGYLSSSGAGHECHYGHRGSHSDTNDSDLLTYTLVGDIPNTNLNTYTIYGLCQTAQTFYVNYQHNGGNDTYSWTAISNFVIQEIAG